MTKTVAKRRSAYLHMPMAYLDYYQASTHVSPKTVWTCNLTL